MRAARSLAPEIVPLTGVRALAAWWVVLFHISAPLSRLCPQLSWPITHICGKGYLGVDLFFVLSGFVIAYNYWDLFAQIRPRGYVRFLWLRLARIYPVHLFALLLSLALLGGASVLRVQTNSDLHDWTASSFLMNLLLVHHWMPKPTLSWNGPSWSISCEWFAYLLFPFLVQTRFERARPVLKWMFAAAPVMLLGTAFQCGAGHGLVRICCGFLTGCILFLIYRDMRPSGRSGSMIAASGVIAFGVFVILSARFPALSGYWAAPSFALLIYGLASDSGSIARLLRSRCAVLWGRASYSLYMTHGLTAILLGKLVPLPHFYGASLAMRGGIACVWVLMFGGVAIVTYRCVEEPARHWMRLLGSRARRRTPDTVEARPAYQQVSAAELT